MSTYKTRLGATLEFDALKERDIINNVEHLKSKHKLSAYTTALYRVAHNNPEVEKLVREEMGGLPNTRDAFFESIKQEIKATMDAIYKLEDNLIEQRATLLYWQNICPTQKLENTAIGVLAIQNHLKDIKKLLYTQVEFPDKDHTYVKDIESLADKVLKNVVEQLSEMNITAQQLAANIPQMPMMQPYQPMQPTYAPQQVTPIPVVAPTIPTPSVPEPKLVAIPKVDTTPIIDTTDNIMEDDFFDDLATFCGG